MTITTNNCTDGSCDWVFGRLRVFPLTEGGTRVEWALHPQFADATPHSFQLQMGQTGSNDSDDWCDVGLPVTNAFYALDDSKRVYGKFQWTHYRVVLTTPAGTYTSKPVPAMGDLDQRFWLRAKDIVRRESLMLRKESGSPGYLLKRRHTGTVCDCVDDMTGEPRKHNCELCYGTGFVSGYYDPVECFFVELDLQKFRNHLDDSRGTVQDGPRVYGRMINDPQVFSYDVWVDKSTDYRWMIHEIVPIVEVQGVPLVLKAEMRLLPFTHPVYTIEITGQIPS